ncbi:UPF0301 protein YqgE [hydrothermal vent metagenome]|uniref:UPF0301 protein YqgE n=1 Tax=hydrothermal vent metagenome TaxID=652676 RepID=A0A3B0YFD7_9ZZZZ
MPNSTKNQSWLTDQLLIAMPQMADPKFFKTVTYLCEHNANGAMGITINRPLEFTVAHMLDQIDIPVVNPELHKMLVLSGGPIQPERGFVLHSPASEWDSSTQISKDLSVTSSQDILIAIGEGQGPENFMVSLGYAGWGPNQLEQEIVNNIWLTVSAKLSILYDSPYEQRWVQAAEYIGIDLDKLSVQAGHA